jgi:hypothetical protein
VFPAFVVPFRRANIMAVAAIAHWDGLLDVNDRRSCCCCCYWCCIFFFLLSQNAMPLVLERTLETPHCCPVVECRRLVIVVVVVVAAVVVIAAVGLSLPLAGTVCCFMGSSSLYTMPVTNIQDFVYQKRAQCIVASLYSL